MATFPSSDGVSLHEHRWPAASPRAALVLVHGYGEHIGRYEHVGKALSEAGIFVAGADLRGHGQSGGPRGYCTRFSDYLDDLATLIARTRDAAPGVPLFLLGHSLGGLIATRFVLDRRANLDGLVLSSPFYRLKLAVPKVKVLAARMMSAIYPRLSLPSGLKGADVTRDPELQRLYDSDPLNNKNATARWFTEVEKTQAEVFRRAREIRLPLLALIGGDDRVADPDAADEVLRRAASPEALATRTVHMLAGQYHEVLNEPLPTRDDNIAIIRDWLLAPSRLERASG